LADLIDTCRAAWGFTGIVPRRILDINAFGNLLVEDATGSYWRICPEELSCQVVAGSRVEFDQLRTFDDFRADWEMRRLVAAAIDMFGQPGEGRCFCLKLPGLLGGKYDSSNVGTIALDELIAFSGDLAAQLRDVPDGAKVILRAGD
jgi:hypothetical protein